jgi:hypothetical protein
MPELCELEPAASERLLRRGTFGRFGIATPAGPEIIPVNYAVRGAAVVARIAENGVLARYADGAPIVFEVDLVDETRWQGWSVVARGVGEVVRRATTTVRDDQDPRPWAAGARTSEMVLAWTELTGRRVGVGWDLEAGMYSTRVAR